MKKHLQGFLSYFKIKHLAYLIPIGAFAMYDSVFSAFSSILAVLSETYPNVSVTSIQMVLAIPALTSIPATLLSGLLAAYVHKKYIAEASLVLLFVGGLAPIVFAEPHINLLFFSSSLIGIGQGLLHPLASSLICQYWEDDDERSRALGFKQAINYIGAAVVSLLVGLLAFSQWNIAYYIYLGIVPVFIISRFLLPKGELEKPLIDKEHRLEGLKELLAPKCLYVFSIFFFAMMFGFTFHTNIAMLVSEKGIGNILDISGISALLNIVSFIVGICYGKIAAKGGKYTLFIGFALLAIGFFVTAFGPTLFVIVIGSIFYGVGTGIQQVTTIYNTSRVVSKHLASIAISVVLCFISAGSSVSPIVIGQLQSFIFGSASGAQAAMAVAGMGYAVLLIVEFIHCRYFVPDSAMAQSLDEPETFIE